MAMRAGEVAQPLKARLIITNRRKWQRALHRDPDEAEWLPPPLPPVTNPAVCTRCLSGEVEHVVQGQQARGHTLQVLGWVAVLEIRVQAAQEGPQFYNNLARMDVWMRTQFGVTHREA